MPTIKARTPPPFKLNKKSFERNPDFIKQRLSSRKLSDSFNSKFTMENSTPRTSNNCLSNLRLPVHAFENHDMFLYRVDEDS